MPAFTPLIKAAADLLEADGHTRAAAILRDPSCQDDLWEERFSPMLDRLATILDNWFHPPFDTIPPDNAKPVPVDQIALVFKDAQWRPCRRPLADLPSAGAPTDPVTGEDMPLTRVDLGIPGQNFVLPDQVFLVLKDAAGECHHQSVYDAIRRGLPVDPTTGEGMPPIGALAKL